MIVDLTGVAASLAATAFSVLLTVGYAEIRAHVKNRFMQELLDGVLGAALGKMQQATAEEIADAQALHPDISNPLVAVGVRFAVNHADAAVEHFGLTPDAIAEKLEARIGLAQIATNIAIAGSPSAANPAPLDPMPVYAPGSMSTEQLNEQSAGSR